MSSAVACGGSAVPLPRPPAPGRSRHNPPNGVATTSPNGPARDLNGHSVRCQLPSASQVSTAPWARSSPQCRPPAGAARVPSSSLFSTSSSRPRGHSAPKAERFAPPQARPNVCRVNDVMEIVSGTGVFAKASGQLVNQGTISLSAFTLSYLVRGWVWGVRRKPSHRLGEYLHASPSFVPVGVTRT